MRWFRKFMDWAAGPVIDHVEETRRDVERMVAEAKAKLADPDTAKSDNGAPLRTVVGGDKVPAPTQSPPPPPDDLSAPPHSDPKSKKRPVHNPRPSSLAAAGRSLLVDMYKTFLREAGETPDVVYLDAAAELLLYEHVKEMNTPSLEELDADGKPVLDEDGKRVYKSFNVREKLPYLFGCVVFWEAPHTRFAYEAVDRPSLRPPGLTPTGTPGTAGLLARDRRPSYAPHESEVLRLGFGFIPPPVKDTVNTHPTIAEIGDCWKMVPADEHPDAVKYHTRKRAEMLEREAAGETKKYPECGLS